MKDREFKRFKTLITESMDVHGILSPEGKIKYLTPSVEPILG